jgi:hypothetical protein
MRSVVHYGDRGAFLGRREGGLEAQDAATQHHDALPAGNGLSQHLGVAEVTQRGDAFRQDRCCGVRVDAGEVGDDRPGTRGEDQPVVVG